MKHTESSLARSELIHSTIPTIIHIWYASANSLVKLLFLFTWIYWLSAFHTAHCRALNLIRLGMCPRNTHKICTTPARLLLDLVIINHDSPSFSFLRLVRWPLVCTLPTRPWVLFHMRQCVRHTFRAAGWHSNRHTISSFITIVRDHTYRYLMPWDILQYPRDINNQCGVEGADMWALMCRKSSF